uniref:Uncharacterized protein n=1 Tax=Acrobeloides nanus TaxID=290746 RepID=A0A914C283_9BILA
MLDWCIIIRNERLFEQRTVVDLYLTRHNKCNLEMNNEEWSLLEKVVNVLDPFNSASKQMCRTDEPISIQFPIARALTADIHAIGDPDLQQMRDSILRLLEEKFNVE